MNYNQNINYKSKRNILFIWISIFILVLIVQLFNLQLVQYQLLYHEADRNRIRLVSWEAPRGLIFDRQGRVIAKNSISYTVAVTPYRLKGRKSSIRKVCKILDLDTLKIFKQTNPKYSFKPIPILRNVDFKSISIIEEHREELPGILIQRGLIRNYPYNEVACHTIGYLDEINNAELKKLKSRSYSYGDLKGRTGIELQYESLLRGDNGYKYIEVNAFERKISDIYPEKTKLPIPGKNITLSLDILLQQKAEQLLSQYNAGAVVALSVKTGEILTLASFPGYNLNIFSGSIDPKDWKKIQENKHNPWFNRTISSRYPPASIYKMVTSAAAIELFGFNGNTHLPQPCKGRLEYGDRYFGCWNRYGHGNLNLIEAITQSCDVYFYQIAQRITLDELHDYATRFNYHKTIGIDLAGEKSGLIPYKGFYTEKLGYTHFPRGILLNLSIGQGENLVTPLQVAFMMSLIANDGKSYTAHLYQKSETASKDSVIYFQAETIEANIKQETFDILKKSMRKVVNHPTGTARRAALPNITVAGKTGTAETNNKKSNHAWFAGYAPYEDPSIAFSCIVENAGHGGSVAAPIIREILEFYFDSLGYQ